MKNCGTHHYSHGSRMSWFQWNQVSFLLSVTFNAPWKIAITAVQNISYSGDRSQHLHHSKHAFSPEINPHLYAPPPNPHKIFQPVPSVEKVCKVSTETPRKHPSEYRTFHSKRLQCHDKVPAILTCSGNQIQKAKRFLGRGTERGSFRFDTTFTRREA